MSECTFSTKHLFHTLTHVAAIWGQELTAVQVAGDGGMGEEEVVEVGVLLEWRYISSSTLPWPDGEVATNAAAAREKQETGDVIIGPLMSVI